MEKGGNEVAIRHCIILGWILPLAVSPRLPAQSVALTGRLLAEDTKGPLPGVAITAIAMPKPLRMITTTTGPDGGFTINAKPGVSYRLCSAATGRYAASCPFSKPLTVQAGTAPAPVEMTAPAGIRMRIRILDPGRLLSSGAALRDPLLLHVFAEEEITRTHIPLPLAPSSSISNAYEAAVVIPISMNWNVAMSSVRAKLFDPAGNAYRSNAPIPRPNDYGTGEYLAVFTLQAQ